jgi:hypothetical protein
MDPDELQAHSRTRTLSCEDLLDQLPALQKLLLRLISCQVGEMNCTMLEIGNSVKLVKKSDIDTCSFIIYFCSLTVQLAQITLYNMP